MYYILGDVRKAMQGNNVILYIITPITDRENFKLDYCSSGKMHLANCDIGLLYV
jgi:hypothetical protein